MANGNAALALLVSLVLSSCALEREPLGPVAWRPIVPEFLPEASRARLYAHLSPEHMVTRTVQVLDAGGEPVAGADVYYLPGDLDSSVLDEHEAWYAERLGWWTWEFYERYGLRTRTDADGRAEVTAVLGHVVARSGRIYGEMPFTAYVHTWRNLSAVLPPIRMVPEAVVRVRIVDPDGMSLPGAGVRVGKDGGTRFADNDEAIVTVRLPESEVDGVVRLFPDVGGYVGGGVAVIPGRAPDPQRLVLPPTGRLVVELRDRDGAGPLRTGWRADLCAPDASGAGIASDTPPCWSGRRLPDGRFAFPFVLPRQSFEFYVQVYSHWPAEPLREHAIRGPERPGQEKHVVVHERDDITVIHGRALDPARRALTEEWLVIDLYFGDGFGGYPLISWTDHDGCFRFFAPDDWGHEGRWQAFRLHTSRYISDPNLYADVRRTPQEGTLQDLGDVVFERAPLLVSGHAVNAEGRPASVTVALVRRVDGVPDLEVGHLATLVGTRFHHYAVPGEGRWEVVVLHPEYWRVLQRIPFEPGTEDLIVRLK